MPEVPRRVVVDTTPIIALALIGKLGLLQHLYGEVVVPAAVYDEVLAGGASGAGRAEFQEAVWLRVISLQDARRADLLADLGRGEAEVIALAQEIDADLVVIDERLARRHARRLGLTLTGTLGVLLKAKERGLIPRITPLVEQFRQGGIHLSDAVITETLRLAGEM